MSDPKRWLDDAGATAFERDLLGAGASLEAPPAMEDRVWGALGARIGAAAAAGAAASATVKSGGASASLKGGAISAALKTKLVVAALVVGGSGATAGAIAVTREAPAPATLGAPASATPAALRATANRAVAARTRTRPTPEAPPSDATPSDTPPAFERAPAHVDAPDAKRAPARTTRRATAAVEPAEVAPAPAASAAPSRLLAEAAVLRDARAALAAGDVARAEAALGSLDQSATLAEERDALLVRCAAARGDRATAASRGARFLADYPKSPLGPQIQAIVAQAKKE